MASTINGKNVAYQADTGAGVVYDTVYDPAVRLYVGGDGDIKVDLVDGTGITFKNTIAGTFLPILVTQVYAAGTTAIDLISLR